MAAHTYAFDTHQYVKKLKEAGFTEQQAEVQAETLADIMGNNLATKQDVETAKLELKRDIKELEMKTDTKLAQLKNELIRWMVAIGAAELSIIIGLKILN